MLARSEKTIWAAGLLKRLREQFGRLGEWMKVLVMDRGYWGARLLLDLRRKEGTDLVIRAGNDEEELPRPKRPGRGERLGRPSIMVYTPP